MATLHYSFFPSMKLMLSSSLLVALLIPCFLQESYAFEARKTKKESHFHTIEFNSLFPASVCTSSTGSIKRQSTLEVFHRHSPCSKLTQDTDATTTSTQSQLNQILSDDQSRVDYIRARLNPVDVFTDRNNHKFVDKKTNLPAQPGESYNTGNYLVTVGIGSPKKTLTLIFDTGSDLTWTQCQPCTSCYKQQDPIFNPSSSTSYSNISCGSSQCSQLTSATGNNLGCSTGTCLYGIQYGDRSFSVGYFSKDTLSITSTDVFPNFLFGCGRNNQGLFGKTAGLIGLGRDPLSLISQTSQKYGKYFSYCLPSTSSSTGHLTLGNDKTSSNLKFTPFDTSQLQGASFYFITINSISVAGTQLPINQAVFQTAGTIIDSGTVITRLPPSAYSALSTAFKQHMSNYPSSPAFSILDTCFDLSNYTSITIPTVSLTFAGNVEVDLDPNGILLAVDTTHACLAFAGNSDSGDTGIFGNTQQKTFEVAYDVAGGKLGFGAGGCN
ncbi:hypothetical protein ACS0TY_012186 [Phlomoides rotata]